MSSRMKSHYYLNKVNTLPQEHNFLPDNHIVALKVKQHLMYAFSLEDIV